MKPSTTFGNMGTHDSTKSSASQPVVLRVTVKHHQVYSALSIAD